MSKSLTELDEFLDKLNYYEPGIIDIIIKYSYTFESNKELKDAYKLWSYNKNECIERYGHTSYWDISKIGKQTVAITKILYKNYKESSTKKLIDLIIINNIDYHL